MCPSDLTFAAMIVAQGMEDRPSSHRALPSGKNADENATFGREDSSITPSALSGSNAHRHAALYPQVNWVDAV
jgi:hypothetical protein